MVANDIQDSDEADNLGATDQQPMTVSVEEYLHDVMAAIDPSHCITVSEQHRKRMIRCLLGYTNKADFNLRLQNINTKLQWEKTALFVSQELTALDSLELQGTAPQFQEGIRLQQAGDPQFSFQQLNAANQCYSLAPTRFFSYLARGKHYQGRFERLLEDVAPNLLATYQDIVEERSEIELMRMIVLDENVMDDIDGTTSNSKKPPPRDSFQPLGDTRRPEIIWKEQLLQLLAHDFGSKGTQPLEDGGQFIGRKNEMDLASYLKQRRTRDVSNRESNASNTLVISNVLVKPINKHLRVCKQNNQKNPKQKQLPYVILSNTNLDGMTSEFDSLVLERVGDKIRIAEMWEAKATLTPDTISDALFKKVPALQTVLQDPEAQIYFYPQNESNTGNAQHLLAFLSKDNNHGSSYASLEEDKPVVFPLVCHPDNTRENNNNTSNTGSNNNSGIKVGIFGVDLMKPVDAARRTQFVQCEVLLGRSTEAVMEGLETGYVSAPDIRPRLDYMIQAARQLKPVLVVPLSSSPGDGEAKNTTIG